jgi:hypothetical protein
MQQEQPQQPSHDSLDRKIDALFASQPLQGDQVFNDRVLHAIQSDEKYTCSQPRLRPRLVRFALPLALPLAAAIAIAAILWPSITATQSASQPQSLLLGEANEILRLEASLSSLLNPETGNELLTTHLLSTLDAAAYSL